MQIMAWCLTESGEVHGATVSLRNWDHYESLGYKKNPRELAGAVGRHADMMAKALESEVEVLEKRIEKLESEKDYETADQVKDQLETLEKDIKAKKEGYLTEKEIGEMGAVYDDIVEVENFLLNLKSEKSKKRVCAFLDKYGYTEYSDLKGLKEIKKYARECFGD